MQKKLCLLLFLLILIPFHYADGARDFNGSSDYIANKADSALNFTTGSISISIWVNPDDITATREELIDRSNSAGGASNFLLYTKDSGKITFGYVNSGGSVFHGYTTDSAYLTNNVWTHIGFTYTYGSPATAKFYINGTLVNGSWTNGDGTATPTKATGDTVKIGRNTFATNWFDGTIADVGLWTTTLTATDMSNLYARTQSIHDVSAVTNLKLWYDFSSNSSSTIINNANRAVGYSTVTGTTFAPSIVDSDGCLYCPQGLVNKTRIDHAQSFDNYHSVLVTAESGSKARESGNVIYTPDDVGKEYKIYYTEKFTSSTFESPYLIYTSDLDGTWTKYGEVFDPNVQQLEDPYVIYNNGTYHMWAEKKPVNDATCESQIAYLTSTDGLSFTLVNATAFNPSGSGWDSTLVASPMVYYDGTTWYLFYEGDNTACYSNGEIGVATSTSPNGTWTRYVSNPIFQAGSGGRFDDVTVVPDDIKLINGTYYMIYHGYGGDINFATGLAKSTDLFTWTRDSRPRSDGQLSGDNITMAMFYTNDKIYGQTASESSLNIFQMYGGLYSEPPTISISQPDGVSDSVTVGDLYNITYTLSDPDDVVTAQFYYDVDNTGLDGTAISGACATAPEGTNVTCSFDTTGVVAGSYYIYGTTVDDVTSANAYSSGVLVISPLSTGGGSGGGSPPQKDLDTDQDGIPDSKDSCPYEKEIFNELDDKDGCPDTIFEDPDFKRDDIFDKVKTILSVGETIGVTLPTTKGDVSTSGKLIGMELTGKQHKVGFNNVIYDSIDVVWDTANDIQFNDYSVKTNEPQFNTSPVILSGNPSGKSVGKIEYNIPILPECDGMNSNNCMVAGSYVIPVELSLIHDRNVIRGMVEIIVNVSNADHLVIPSFLWFVLLAIGVIAVVIMLIKNNDKPKRVRTSNIRLKKKSGKY